MKVLLSLFALAYMVSAFNSMRLGSQLSRSHSSLKMFSPIYEPLSMSDKKEPKKEQTSWERIMEALNEPEDPKKKKGPPIYTPGPYQLQLLSALAYVIPIVDSSDLGKYMFEAYPAVGGAYNAVFGPVSAIYNGVPFLPFAVFFVMSYICRAPNFPVEVRFHFAQAFMISLVQFIPSLTFGFLEKAGVPGMAIAYNTVFLWVTISSVMMQLILLNPVSSAKNPMVINIVGWAMRYMNYTPDMKPK